jgi:hypothetical protein
MMQRLYATDLPMADFLTTIKKFQFNEESLLLAFSPAQFKFQRYSLDESFLAATDQGRIFSPAGELKWRRVGKHMRMVYLGNQMPPGVFTDYSVQLEPLKAVKHQLILWGIRTDTRDEWIEQQVPHRFSYPVTGKQYSRGRLALVVESWYDRGGIPVFSRYHHIKEIEGEK